jgi:hypothetical protein
MINLMLEITGMILGVRTIIEGEEAESLGEGSIPIEENRGLKVVEVLD